VKIIGWCGRLRKASFNLRLLQTAEKYLPEGVELEYLDCGALPLYNADLDGEHKPEPVVRLLDSCRNSDAFLFATPEYNYSLPGVLKNAIDWASRPAYQSVMAHKPAGIISASTGVAGGARMQSHLRQVLGGTLTPVYPSPELLVAQAQGKFDAQGRLTDADTATRLQQYMHGFVIWAGRTSAR
jgi:chromate reductase